MRRTSSQTSGASTNSKKTYPAQRTPKCVSDSSSVSSLRRDPSLTSFPSLTSNHESNPQDVSTPQPKPNPSRTTSQKVRERKRTLASLTSASGSFEGQPLLFDDSPRSSLDIPGALHLASDDHIGRLIARSGAVKLVRQFAQDLALRDAELSALRARADDRERELKRMLREAEVSSSNIERRLHNLEVAGAQNDAKATDTRPGTVRNVTSRIDDMMHQAMAEEVGEREYLLAEGDPSATVRPSKSGETITRNSAMDPADNKSRGGSISGWQLWGGSTTSQRPSRASSIIEDDTDDASATTKARGPSSNTKRRGLDSIFQPTAQSTSYFIGGANKTVKKPIGDDASLHSQKSNRSIASWTKIFAGVPAIAKDDGNRPRASSEEQDKSAGSTSASAAESAMLSRVRTNPGHISNSAKLHASALSKTVKARPIGRRTPSTVNLSTSPDHVRRDSDTTNLGPVEMDAILTVKPPTMTHTNNNESDGLLTDRFGFIYDQRQRKRQTLAASNKHRNRMSGVESLGSFRTDSDSDEVKTTGTLSPPRRPATPVSVDEEAPKKWSDYLKVSTKTPHARPTELLSHTPSAGAVVTVSTADASGTITPPRARGTSISVKSHLALPTTSFVPMPSGTSVNADVPTLANNQNRKAASTSEQEPVKLLLEQLTLTHDMLQGEREAKFNDFLRKVRAERSHALSDRASNNAPEADLPNGELIGNLGHPKNKSKYLQFKALTLAGIPVSLRPKIWAECSGASSLRIPGYYEDLVARSHDKGNMDPDIAVQIAADIGRTLTDNIFFRSGPGKGRLEEILKAYSLHNPEVGYCQGMNLITGSLLLICATTEDVFWLLVAIVDKILPSRYFDPSLKVSRADQVVLRGYLSEVLPNLDAKLDALGVELEACSFQWFLSLYSAVVSAEPLFRIWDVVLCLNSSEGPPPMGASLVEPTSLMPSLPGTPTTLKSVDEEVEGHDGTSSTFLFQLSLALLKLNEASLLALESPADFYQYMNHNM